MHLEFFPFHTHFASRLLPFQQKEYSITFLEKPLGEKKLKKICEYQSPKQSASWLLG